MEINRDIELSVIIPVYNAERYIRQSIDSVIGQIPDNSEILLIDDGSTDSSGIICDSYKKKDRRIKVIHQENKGVSEARNKGVESARGRKIFFMDSDDYIEPGYFNQLLSHDADLVISNYEAFYENGTENIRGEFQTYEYKSLKSFLQDFYIYYPIITNPVWGKVYNVDIIRKNAIKFPPDISIGEDLLFNLQYFRCCKSFYVDNRVAVMYRQNENTLSKQTSPSLFAWYERCYSEIEGVLRENQAFTKQNETVFYEKYFGNYYESIQGMYFLDRKARNKRIKGMIKNQRVQEAAKRVKVKGVLMRGVKTATQLKNVRLLIIHIHIYMQIKSIKRRISGK